MKIFSNIFLILLLAVVLNGCEKDDLCTTDQAVTPRLVIEFRDVLNPLDFKAVDQIQVQEIGSTEPAPLDSNNSTILTDVETISIPLRTDSNRTSYDFILTEDGAINSDNIDFNYIIEEEYVSRACGFRVIYNNLVAVLTSETRGTQWINSTVIVENEITNDTQDIHVQILH
ncbi:DUF6452 family protein [uncultured Nonlabens sp.]|uniref:DUF6452 family protein n=1 Tax=uncultured Nonlabens sp. TaxID=859306 RepID=UPI00262A1B69|nr:DUF6452 family protein [uncultured Nonlabens sp.]